MSSKIRVVHYCNQLSLGGTERTMEIFCKYLDRTKFEIFAVSRRHNPPFFKKLNVLLASFLGIKSAKAKKRLWAQMNARIPNFIHILGRDHIRLATSDDDLRAILKELKPDVLHVHTSGRAEAPTNDSDLLKDIPVVVTTNQFELQNTSDAQKYIKKIYFVSEWLWKNKATWAANDPRVEVFYNPEEKPFTTESLRRELGIPASAFVFGRVGRADPGIHDPISLNAYKLIQNENTWFLALSAPDNMVAQAKELGLMNFVALPPTADDVALSKFYNTIDVLAHARRDGETFGCNLAEAMIHTKPCISHISDFMNAQTETIGSGGFVVDKGDHQAYAQHMKRLRDDKEFYKQMSEKALARALSEFEAVRLTDRLGKTYENLLRK